MKIENDVYPKAELWSILYDSRIDVVSARFYSQSKEVCKIKRSLNSLSHDELINMILSLSSIFEIGEKECVNS